MNIQSDMPNISRELVPAAPIRVIAQLHALKLEGELIESEAPAGWSILDIIGLEDDKIVVTIEGKIIPTIDWASCYPNSGSLVNIYLIPGEDFGRALLMIAAVVVAIYTAGVIGGATGWFAVGEAASIGFYTAAAVINIGLNLAINALIPPKLPEISTPESFTRLNSITGVRNKLGVYTPIPKLYGTMRYFPPIPMTATPYTETLSTDQFYIRMFLCLGYGPMKIGSSTADTGSLLTWPGDAQVGANVFIGETPISEFDDVEIEIGDPTELTLYSKDIDETALADVFVSATGEGSGSGTYTDNVSVTRVSEADADELSITLEFPAGLFTINSSGKTKAAEVTVTVEYRITGSGDPWTLVNNNTFVPFYQVNISERNSFIQLTNSSTTRIIRHALRETIWTSVRWIPVGGPEQYDVRITRVQTYHEASEADSTSFTWRSLRTIRTSRPFIVPNTIGLAIRIRANDQISGSLDNISVKAQAIISTYNGSSWVDAATNSPAWALKDVLSGNGTKTPIAEAQLDAAGLKDWNDWCAANGFEFNAIFDNNGTAFDFAREIASIGRASFAIRDNLYTVIREDTDLVPLQIITPRNVKGFSAQRVFPTIPHAIRAKFTDPTTWEDTEVTVYDDGYNAGNATIFDNMDYRGITIANQAWKLTRFHLAQLRLRQETFKFTLGIEQLVVQRGNVVRIVSDTILVGLGAGRISGTTFDGTPEATSFNSDERVIMEPAKTYGVQIRSADGSGGIVINESQITTITPYTNAVTLLTPLPDVQDGDLFVWGEWGSIALDCKVITVSPREDLTADVTCVPLSNPGILNADIGVIPAYNPVLTAPINLKRLPSPVPEIEQIRSDENVLVRDVDGSLKSRIAVDYLFASGNPTVEVECRWTENDGFLNFSYIIVNSNESTIFITDVEEGVAYNIWLRSRRPSGDGDFAYSSWSPREVHTVVGKSSPPADVTNFQATTENYSLRLTWNPVADLDLSHYEIRKGASWASGTFVAVTPAIELVLNVQLAGTHDYHIKAVDTTGNYSNGANTTAQVINAPGVPSTSIAFVGENLTIDWVNNPGDFAILESEIRRGGSDWATATFVARTSSTSFTIKADWSGNETWRVANIDRADNVGISSSDIATVALAVSSALTVQVIDNNVLLRWSATSGTLPIKHYRILKGDTFGGAQQIGTADVTFNVILEIQAGTYTYWVVPVDTADNDGSEISITATVDSPPDFILQSKYTTDWFGLDTRNDVIRLPNQQRKGLTFVGNDPTGGSPEYVALDAAILNGKQDFTFEWVWGSTDTSIPFPTIISGGNLTRNTEFRIYKKVSTNEVVLVYWSGSSILSSFWALTEDLFDGILRQFALVRNQTSALAELWVDGVSQGTKSLTTPQTLSISADHLVLGQFTLTSGNFSNTNQLVGTLDEVRIWNDIRTNTEINNQLDFELDGFDTSLAWYGRMNEGQGLIVNDLSTFDNDANMFNATWAFPTTVAIMPFDESTTFGDKLTVHGYATLQDQINDGYPYFAQPVPTTAIIEEVYDLGSVVSQSQVTVEVPYTAIELGAAIQVLISHKKLYTDAWTDGTLGEAADFLTDFRYLKIKLSITSDATGFGTVDNWNTQAAVKRKTDEGEFTISANPTTISFNLNFVDIQSITVTAQGTAARTAVVDFTDVPNPTDFDVYLFNASGAAVTGDVRWIARGV